MMWECEKHKKEIFSLLSHNVMTRSKSNRNVCKFFLSTNFHSQKAIVTSVKLQHTRYQSNVRRLEKREKIQLMIHART